MGGGDYLMLLEGAGTTLAISVLSILLAMPLGLCLALIRWARMKPFDLVVASLVSLLRVVPMITLVLLVYFALPIVGVSLNRFSAAVLTLALGSMAFNCEIWRGALLAFPADQIDAACAVGMTRGLRFRRIILPQIWRWALPALVNEMTLLIKVSPAVAVIGVVEITRAAVRIGAETYQSLPPFLVALALYLPIVSLFVWLQRVLERRYDPVAV